MLQLTSRDLTRSRVNTLAIPVCKNQDIHDDKPLTAIVGKARSRDEFSGGEDETLILYDLPEVRADRVLFIGLGKIKKLTREKLRNFAAAAVANCIRTGLADLMIVIPAAGKIKIEASLVIEAIQEGACLGNYQFERYKKSRHASLKKIRFYVDAKTAKKNRALPRKVETVCRGTLLAREWVNMAPNDKMPEKLVELITTEAKKTSLSIEVIKARELERKKFGAMLAVAAGSKNKPVLLRLTHTPRRAKKTVALIGKGVTFDAGGINLKPSGSIETMKKDMAGAAAVAATLVTVARLGLNLNVMGVIPMVENMPSGSAYRPGDIITSYSGKTVEVGNTDAEGRLILIDAMTHALIKYHPQIMIDMATLTGACMVALGDKIAGLFTPDNRLADAIHRAGENTGERCWRMPLPEDYKKNLKSDFADLKSVGSKRWGGAITAALFLSEFAGDARWAHIDIAGTAYADKGSVYCGSGGTGFGVRLLCKLLETL